ncbi:tRNA preQ1(34) S-adenosylmethionine ribosyltransferase-isomerase QueA [Blastochloris sulfoviridis]|uniref:S-adenosylmethionine:tRNA ribosyltransferase-isomerase n=1 Tax=Blastochloris sulfoviridis TaxID=50712 RepID=A0A5M6I0G6_9HYPH|nr:tRNA preQ1(34) S-adenosylmethionine ribosyltransferase-isomerase QueA [Blastochloris sulfoviridis]KAA5601672.1 tRNA preQ1(34) S-adenosylmethionine ribosyltransferase-isomerase QueA [Blastochloris sulfoviridis]
MRLSDFDYDLPEGRIALRPAEPRDSARLLVVRPGAGLEDRAVRDLPDLLQPGDALVFNDTRVILAELVGLRVRGEAAATIHFNLHKRVAEDRWLAFARPAKRLQAGDRVRFGAASEGIACELAAFDAEVAAKSAGGEVELRFAFSGVALDEAIARHGHVPLPPYIAARRADDARDRTDYQTVFARHDGSVAAPTAGLHFTPDLLARLAARGISQHFVTLHVGAGTFLPVKTYDVRAHRMHAEWGEVSAATVAALDEVRERGGRIVAVGTTSARLLETAAKDGTLRAFSGETDIFITPGYAFRAVDVLMSNFHLPKSTLFMLVSAFCGLETMRAAYAHAIEAGYRFYSYGDASLLFPDRA